MSKKGNDSKSSKKSQPDSEDEPMTDDNKQDYKRQIRVVAVLLLLFSVLLLLSLISYSKLDEANTQISFREFFKLLAADEALRAKYETTHNWLGVLGAIISDLFYSKTIGYSIIIFPIFMIFWAKNLFLKLSLRDKLIKNTIVYLVIATLFASIMATLQNLSLFANLSQQWSGIIGIFITSMISAVIGNVGTLLVLLTLIVVTLIFGTDIRWDNLFSKLSIYNYIPFDRIRKIKNTFIERTPKKEAPESDESGETDEMTQIPAERSLDKITGEKTSSILIVDDNEEPALIIKRNVDYGNSSINQKFGVAIPSEPAYSPYFGSPLNVLRETETYDFPVPAKRQEVPKPVYNYIPHTETPPAQVVQPVIEVSNVEKIDVRPEREYSNRVIDDNITIVEKFPPINNITDKFMIESDEPEEVYYEEEEDIPTLVYDKNHLTVTVNEKLSDPDEVEPPSLLCNLHDEMIDYASPKSHILIEQEEYAGINEEELEENARILQEKLETFKIYIENLSVTPGPVVTQYEFVPAPGIKISRIESLSDDISMALKAPGIRIIAPIPGKGTVGIEIPNRRPSLVRFSSIIKSKQFYNNEFKLPLALGKLIDGEVFCVDLAKMPHLLIAGSTGSGKSVGINTIISSLLFKIHPKDLKFVIIDPKKVELKLYSALSHHFLAKSPDIDDLIITNPQDAVSVLKSVCAEMDNRYDILSQVGQRNIGDYNANVLKGKYANDKEMLHRPMPYIVVVIDELADLMLTASKEVEAPIIRIAQLARAVGIHLIVATQRPSVDVITGIIKANFPARMAYLVASKIDSRTILDMSGAEQLLGNGDMLFLPNGSPKPVRVQNAFISTDEVEELCEFIANQNGYSQPYMLPSLVEKSIGSDGYSIDDCDPLFEEAARLIIRHQMGSVSLIQRRLKVGYARAGRIVDELEAAGVVGPQDGSKARIVLMDSESDLEAIL
jgi:S-DNA-T family DNA segregation ATPase FtsK/SpoIIIE